MTPVLPGATIGIFGGGQLGRMMTLAARVFGYHVIILDPDPHCAASAVADRVIASQGDVIGDGDAAQTIWLRPEPEPKGKKDDTIYRYDRAGLLMALKSAGAGRGK